MKTTQVQICLEWLGSLLPLFINEDSAFSVLLNNCWRRWCREYGGKVGVELLMMTRGWWWRCFKSRPTRLYTPLCPSVRQAVCQSVTLYFFCFLRSLASLLLPKWSTDKYGPCPPAHDWGSHVSGLLFKNITAYYPLPIHDLISSILRLLAMGLVVIAMVRRLLQNY